MKTNEQGKRVFQVTAIHKFEVSYLVPAESEDEAIDALRDLDLVTEYVGNMVGIDDDVLSENGIEVDGFMPETHASPSELPRDKKGRLIYHPNTWLATEVDPVTGRQLTACTVGLFPATS